MRVNISSSSCSSSEPRHTRLRQSERATQSFLYSIRYQILIQLRYIYRLKRVPFGHSGKSYIFQRAFIPISDNQLLFPIHSFLYRLLLLYSIFLQSSINASKGLTTSSRVQAPATLSFHFRALQQESVRASSSTLNLSTLKVTCHTPLTQMNTCP